MYLLSIDLHGTMDNELAGLAGTTSEHGTEDSHVESALERCVGHLHVRRGRGLPGRITLETRTTTSRLLGSVILSEVACIHGDDGSQTAGEHALPLTFAHHLTMVAACKGFGRPFLLEKCAEVGAGLAETAEIVEVVFAPRLADFLRAGGSVGGRWQRDRTK